MYLLTPFIILILISAFIVAIAKWVNRKKPPLTFPRGLNLVVVLKVAFGLGLIAFGIIGYLLFVGFGSGMMPGRLMALFSSTAVFAGLIYLNNALGLLRLNRDRRKRSIVLDGT